MRFPERCGSERSIVRLDTTAREADLAGMIGEIGASLRQQHLQSLLSIHDRHEDRRRGGLARATRQAEAVGKIAQLRRDGTRKALGDPGLCLGRGEIEQR